MFRRISLFGAALACLSGCTTPQRPVDNAGDLNWEDPSFAQQALVAKSDLDHRPVAEADPGPLIPEKRWVSLRRWNLENGFGPVEPLSPLSPSGFFINNTNGLFVLWPGMNSARWNGLEVRLGFKPRLIDNQLFLHVLDARKTLYPLLSRGESPAIERGEMVVIDAGHGGSNTGTRSVLDGRFEKEFTLDWALRLRELLEARGWTVLLTRTNDVDLTLAERVAFARTNKADLFISLHFNSSPSRSDQAGMETYCLTPTGMPSTLVRDGEDDVSLVLPNNSFDEWNLLCAIRLQRALVKHAGGIDRGVRHARFMGVLRGQHCPAVLVEGGYLSNPGEARQISDPAYREKLAEALAWALFTQDSRMVAVKEPADSQ